MKLNALIDITRPIVVIINDKYKFDKIELNHSTSTLTKEVLVTLRRKVIVKQENRNLFFTDIFFLKSSIKPTSVTKKLKNKSVINDFEVS